ncbi:MAG TPA: DNA polymerase Y family protein [Planctomycetaceae bacterium]|nr:DNA polymerase Y family protein [Planctomycetaceae bacterium]
MNRRILCLWLPHWPVQRLVAGRPERDGCFPAAGRSSTPSGPRADGVEHDPRACRSALRRLARWCQRFSPYVGLEDAAEPESLLLDVTGCTHLFGGEQKMLEQVVRAFRGWRLTIRPAIADTVGAAWARAHYNERSRIEDTDALPGGSRLNGLPIEALRLPVETLQLLRELDLRTVGQVEALPRCTLPSRFGTVLLERLDQLFGRRSERFTPERDAGPIEAGWIFEDPVSDRRALETVLGRLIEQIVARLEPRGEGLVRLVCWLRVESRESRVESRSGNEHRTLNIERSTSNGNPRTTDHGPRIIVISLARPTRSLKRLRELIRLQLERLAPSAEVATVHVRVAETAPLETRQLELFATDADCDRRRRSLAALVERLTSRLGERSVLQSRLVPDFQPEFAVRFEPLLGHPLAKHKAQSTKHHSALARPRPLRLLTAPARVQATSIVPDGPPIRFPWRGGERRVQRWWGPERIETGWWRDEHVRRDYYRVETTTGEWFWLFRERAGGEWFLHGCFE